MPNIHTTFIDFLMESNYIMDYNQIQLKHFIEQQYPEFDEYQIKNSLKSINLLKKLLKFKTIIIYRILNVNSANEINVHNLGNHYTTDSHVFSDSASLYDIGVDSDKPMFIVSIKIDTKHINVDETIQARINYPHEEEIFIDDDNLDNMKIIHIQEFKK